MGWFIPFALAGAAIYATSDLIEETGETVEKTGNAGLKLSVLALAICATLIAYKVIE